MNIFRYRLFLDDLAAMAFIRALESGDEKRFLPYQVIEKYGADVVDNLEKATGKRAVISLSREQTYNFYLAYPDFFFEESVDGLDGVALAPNKSIDDLIEKFCGVMPVDVLKAFRATPLSALLIAFVAFERKRR